MSETILKKNIAESLKYFQATGRRKTAIARVRLTPGKGLITLNNHEVEDLDNKILLPLIIADLRSKFNLSIITSGGGITSQKDAIKLGIARALIEYDSTLRPTLRKAGLLTRDSREKERKKPGLKRARKAPQWQKR